MGKIDESINGIEKRILPIYDNDADHEALVTAIDTMRKYQKIEQIYERFQKDDNYYLHMAWLDVMEVIKDGKID